MEPQQPDARVETLTVNLQERARVADQEEKLSWLWLVRNRSLNTTGHGFPKLFSGLHHQKMLWAVVFTACVVLLIVQVSQMVVDIFNYPTTLSVFEESRSAVEWPTITLCNNNKLVKSATRQLPSSDPLRRAADYEALLNFRARNDLGVQQRTYASVQPIRDSGCSVYRAMPVFPGVSEGSVFPDFLDAASQFRCRSDNQCIPQVDVCDGVNDCDDRSDESAAVCGVCPPGQFECRDGDCIPGASRCDGVINCFDGSDEEAQYCDASERNGDWFYCCNSLRIIWRNQTCDGVVDCYEDGSDESLQACHGKAGGLQCKVPPSIETKANNFRVDFLLPDNIFEVALQDKQSAAAQQLIGQLDADFELNFHHDDYLRGNFHVFFFQEQEGGGGGTVARVGISFYIPVDPQSVEHSLQAFDALSHLVSVDSGVAPLSEISQQEGAPVEPEVAVFTGQCQDANGAEVASMLITLSGPSNETMDCLQACANVPGIYGCEINTGSRLECRVMVEPVTQADGMSGKECHIFSGYTPSAYIWAELAGRCTLEGVVPVSPMIQSSFGDVECVEICKNYNSSVTGCHEDDFGCYVHFGQVNGNDSYGDATCWLNTGEPVEEWEPPPANDSLVGFRRWVPESALADGKADCAHSLDETCGWKSRSWVDPLAGGMTEELDAYLAVESGGGGRAEAEWLAMASEGKLEALGHKLGNMLLECTFAGLPCFNQSRYDVEVVSSVSQRYGRCYSFHVSPPSEKSGKNAGFSMLLSAEVYEYESLLAPDAALVLFVSDNNLKNPDGSLFVDSSSRLTLQPGSLHTVRLDSSRTSKVPAPYSECGLYGEGSLAAYATPYQCEQDCNAAEESAVCGCVTDVQYSSTHSVQLCSGQNETAKECSKEVKANVKCACPDSCEFTYFTLQHTSADWPIKTAVVSLMSDIDRNSNNDRAKWYSDKIVAEYLTDGNSQALESIRACYLRLDIYANDLTQTVTEERPVYDAVTILSTLGGLLGLYLGMSVMTVFEGVDFLFDCRSLLHHRHRYSSLKRRQEAAQSDGEGSEPPLTDPLDHPEVD